jgi:hypothetical protein
MRQDREQWRQVSNSPAIPLPIPLPTFESMAATI